MRLDGASTWSDVAALPSSPSPSSSSVTWAFNSTTKVLTVTGVADGVHTLEVRTLDATQGADSTPWSVLWDVTTSAPTVTFLRTPPTSSAAPADTASFYLQSSSSLQTTYNYTVYNTSATPAVVVTSGTTLRCIVTVTGLTPGARAFPIIVMTPSRVDAHWLSSIATTFWERYLQCGAYLRDPRSCSAGLPITDIDIDIMFSL